MEGSENPSFRHDIQLSNPSDYGSLPKESSVSISSMDQDPPRPTSNVPMPVESSYVLFFQVISFILDSSLYMNSRFSFLF